MSTLVVICLKWCTTSWNLSVLVLRLLVLELDLPMVLILHLTICVHDVHVDPLRCWLNSMVSNSSCLRLLGRLVNRVHILLLRHILLVLSLLGRWLLVLLLSLIVLLDLRGRIHVLLLRVPTLLLLLRGIWSSIIPSIASLAWISRASVGVIVRIVGPSSLSIVVVPWSPISVIIAIVISLRSVVDISIVGHIAIPVA